MGSVIKRGEGQWQAQAYKTSPKTGKPVRKYKTFTSEQEARNWVTTTEAEILVGGHTTPAVSGVFLRDEIQTYLEKITPQKGGAKQESDRLRKWLKHPWAEYALDQLHQSEVIDYVNERRSAISKRGSRLAEQTIKHELNTLSNVYGYAIARGRNVHNPIKKIGKEHTPKGSRKVFTRILPAHWEKLKKELKKCRNQHYVIIAELGIETGMRQGEILRLTPVDLFLDKKYVNATDFVNEGGVLVAKIRHVPLSPRAVELFKSITLPKKKDGGIWGLTSGDGLSRAFTSACKKVDGLEKATFNSTRHEAASRMAKHMPIHTLQKVMGHKSIATTAIYYNPTADDLVEAMTMMHKPAKQRKKPTPKKAIAG